jgi:uncharacterized membrane protein
MILYRWALLVLARHSYPLLGDFNLIVFLSIVIPIEEVSRYSKGSCREKMSWAFVVVVGLNLKVVLSMVREYFDKLSTSSHHDKLGFSKFTKSKIFLVFKTCHSMRWFLWGERKPCGGVHEWRET